MKRVVLPILLIAISCLSMAQDRRVHEIVLKNGERVYGFVDEGDWENSIIRVELDHPWLPPEERSVKLNRFDINFDETAPQNSTSRNIRLSKGWTENGGVEVDTPDGPKWVHAEQAEHAKRARALEEAALLEQHPPDNLEPQQESPQSTVAEAAPGFWSAWGMHIGVLFAGVILAAAIVWGVFLS